MKEVVFMKDLPYLAIDVAPGTLLQTIAPLPPDTPDLGSWTRYGTGTQPYFVHEQTIDVAGLTQQELTFFPMGGDVQRTPVSMGPTGAFSVEWIIVSVSPVDWGKVNVKPVNGWTLLPGQYEQNDESFQQMIWGRSWTWTLNTNLQQNFAVAVNTSLIGSGEPTNGDRMYLYRIIQNIVPTNPGVIEFGAGRLLLSGQLRKEEEYAQLMRLRRTYELQQQPDRD